VKAFPNIELTVSEMGQIRKIYENNTGMDLRDYFAARAMQAMLSNPSTKKVERKDLSGFAQVSYEMADALMLARGTQCP
jgi:hypothetical protein